MTIYLQWLLLVNGHFNKLYKAIDSSRIVTIGEPLSANLLIFLATTMSSYTCISCRVAFADGEVQRAHYKTDWHRYNLKRKVADMPPVTAENFQERVLAQRAATEQQVTGATVSEGCTTCNKKFSSSNAYQNHLQSHKHQQAEKQALLAAQKKVEMMNEKNLEKGLGDDGKVDHNAKNEALQQALKPPQRPNPEKAQASGVERPAADKAKPEKPPRLQWFEGQAKKMEGEELATAEEGMMSDSSRPELTCVGSVWIA